MEIQQGFFYGSLCIALTDSALNKEVTQFMNYYKWSFIRLLRIDWRIYAVLYIWRCTRISLIRINGNYKGIYSTVPVSTWVRITAH